MRLLRILGRVLALSVQRELAHRVNLTISVTMMVIDLAASVATLGLVFTQTATLAGWRPAEALALLGAFQLVTGLLNTFIEPNLAWFAEKVTGGRLDDTLLQPVPSFFMLSLGACQPLALPRVLLGGALLVWATVAGEGVTALGVAGCVALLAAGVVITWAVRVLLATLAFWAPGFEPSVLFSAFWQLGRYPVGVYHPVVRQLLTYVVPVAFVATFPAEALMRGGGGLGLGLGALGAGAALLALGAAGLAWRAGVRRYTGATS
ncbi:MAG: hypothetical protein K0R39_5163 [Symbiobacteriaceae bacterium]|nr:hypothetical protein [Symbiobacteriaceae bacterium]